MYFQTRHAQTQKPLCAIENFTRKIVPPWTPSFAQDTKYRIWFITKIGWWWDRSKNVEAAVEVGMVGIVFQDAKQVERELAGFGYVF